jgi:hypothetical protein
MQQNFIAAAGISAIDSQNLTYTGKLKDSTLKMV